MSRWRTAKSGREGGPRARAGEHEVAGLTEGSRRRKEQESRAGRKHPQNPNAGPRARAGAHEVADMTIWSRWRTAKKGSRGGAARRCR
jgi:hypothetical protein